MFRMNLAERLGRTLAELDASMGARELMLWYAKAQIENAVDQRMNKHKGLSYASALDQVRASHRSSVERKR